MLMAAGCRPVKNSRTAFSRTGELIELVSDCRAGTQQGFGIVIERVGIRYELGGHRPRELVVARLRQCDQIFEVLHSIANVLQPNARQWNRSYSADAGGN